MRIRKVLPIVASAIVLSSISTSASAAPIGTLSANNDVGIIAGGNVSIREAVQVGTTTLSRSANTTATGIVRQPSPIIPVATPFDPGAAAATGTLTISHSFVEESDFIPLDQLHEDDFTILAFPDLSTLRIIGPSPRLADYGTSLSYGAGVSLIVEDRFFEPGLGTATPEPNTLATLTACGLLLPRRRRVRQ